MTARLRLRLCMVAYVIMAAFACNLAIFGADGWLQVSLLFMALVCAETVGRIREYLEWTKR